MLHKEVRRRIYKKQVEEWEYNYSEELKIEFIYQDIQPSNMPLMKVVEERLSNIPLVWKDRFAGKRFIHKSRIFDLCERVEAETNQILSTDQVILMAYGYANQQKIIEIFVRNYPKIAKQLVNELVVIDAVVLTHPRIRFKTIKPKPISAWKAAQHEKQSENATKINTGFDHGSDPLF